MLSLAKRFALTCVLALAGVMTGYHAHAQVNPFNPDYAWCNTRGAIAMRGATAWQCLLPGTAGQVLQSGGAGANPSWLTVSGAGTVTSVGIAVPSFMTVSNSPITSAGNITLGYASGVANRVFATPDGSAGAPTFRTMASADLPNSGNMLNGDLAGTFPTLTIRNGFVSNAKLANMAPVSVKANVTGSAAAPTDATMSAILDASFTTTAGSLLYRNLSGWSYLAPGASNLYLRSNGPGSDLSWNDPSGGAGVGTVTSVTCGTGLTGGTITTSGTCALDYSTITNAIPGYTGAANAPSGIIGQTVNISSNDGTISPTAWTAASIVVPTGYFEMTAAYTIDAVSNGSFKNILCEWTPNNTRVPDGKSLSVPNGFNIINAATVNVATSDPWLSGILPDPIRSYTGNYTTYLRCIAPSATGDLRFRVRGNIMRYR